MAEAIENGVNLAEEVGFPPFDTDTFASQIFWLVLTFAFLYWFVSKIALPRLASVIEERKQRVETDLADAARLKAQADEAFAAYEASLAAAKNNARVIAEETRASLASESEVQRKSLEQDLATRIANAEKTIDDTKTKALSHVGEIASEATSSIVERLLGSAPTQVQVDKAVKSALDR